MDVKDIDSILRQTFDDCKISRSESKALRKVFADLTLSSEDVRYIRNRAFEIVNESLKSHDDKVAVKWLEDIIKILDNEILDTATTISEAYFSPGEDCLNKIIELINYAKYSIDVCVFTITDDRISQALADAHNRRVIVRIITDDEKADDRGSDIWDLGRIGMDIATDRSPSHMHHKFAIFDGKVLLNGSFNWTRSASTQNQENVIITSESTLVDAFQQEFNQRWQEWH